MRHIDRRLAIGATLAFDQRGELHVCAVFQLYRAIAAADKIHVWEDQRDGAVFLWDLE